MKDTNADKSYVVRSNINEGNVSEINEGQKKLKIKRIIYYILGTLEVLFALRLVFKLLGANTESTFISLIYSITDMFLAPFNGIFRTAVNQGIEMESVLEPALIIAMIVYALLAWGIVKFIDIINNRKSI